MVVSNTFHVHPYLGRFPCWQICFKWVAQPSTEKTLQPSRITTHGFLWVGLAISDRQPLPDSFWLPSLRTSRTERQGWVWLECWHVRNSIRFFLGESDKFSWVDEASRYSRGIMLRCYTVYDWYDFIFSYSEANAYVIVLVCYNNILIRGFFNDWLIVFRLHKLFPAYPLGDSWFIISFVDPTCVWNCNLSVPKRCHVLLM